MNERGWQMGNNTWPDAAAQGRRSEHLHWASRSIQPKSGISTAPPIILRHRCRHGMVESPDQWIIKAESSRDSQPHPAGSAVSQDCLWIRELLRLVEDLPIRKVQSRTSPFHVAHATWNGDVAEATGTCRAVARLPRVLEQSGTKLTHSELHPAGGSPF
jgi:hypothetical protein